MDALIIVLLVGVVAVAAMAAGYLLGARPGAALKAEAAEARERLTALERDHAVASEQAGRLRLTEESLKVATEERNRAQQEVARLQPLADRAATAEIDLDRLRGEVRTLAEAKAAFEQGQAERERAFAQQLAQVKELEAKLETRFSELAGKAVETAHDSFLKRAGERFGHESKAQEQKIQTLLQPVEATLKRYQDAVGRAEEDRRKDFGLLAGQIEAMRSGSERVSAEAAKLVNALRNAPKARGRWGEQQLRNVLEACGLSEHCDFHTEVSVDTEHDGRLRPDVVVRVPGGQNLVIDAKVSLNAYQDAYGCTDETERSAFLDAHAGAIRSHVKSLGDKAYWAQFENTPDFVVMFIPGEHFLSAALEQDGKLWDFAFERRVLLATPTNLIAIARTVAAVWRQEGLATEARQIGQLGKEMFERLAVAADHLRVVGSGLGTAVTNYNKFVSSFERNVLSTGRKFQNLNIEPSSKTIAMIEPEERTPTYGDLAGERPTLVPPAKDEVTAAE